jgi:non-heme chloroperoxidase
MELRGAVQPGGGARSGRRRWLVAGGLAASTVGAGLLQHRTVLRQRRRAEAVDRRAAGLALPSTVVHHRIDTDDGGVVHAVEAGTGRPLVLVHGITLAAEIWSLQLAGLADRHRVVAVDLRGHGQSVPGRDGFGDGVKRLAADVRQLLDALDVTGGILVGHSLGGMTSLQLVLDAERAWLSRRLAGLALVDTSAEPLAGVRGARTARGPVTASLSRGLLLLERAGVAAAPSTDLGWWAARAAFGADPDPAHVAFTEALGRATPLGTVAGLLGPLAAFDVADRLGTIDLPTVVVVGTQDRLTPPRHARRLAEGIPGAELVELARAGHMPMLERPGELARILTDLADRVGVDA